VSPLIAKEIHYYYRDGYLYSPNIVEVGFSELWCAIGRASLLLRSGPRFRHVHRSKLLEDAQVIPARSYHLRNLSL